MEDAKKIFAQSMEVEDDWVCAQKTLEVEENEVKTEKRSVHKLDVMTSHQFNHLVVINGILVVYTFLHVLGLYLGCMTIMKGPDQVTKGLHGETLTLETCKPFPAYMMSIYLLDLAGRCFLMLLSILYLRRIITSKKVHRSEEQGWCVVMIILTALSYMPILNIWTLHDNYFVANDPQRKWYNHAWFRSFIGYSRTVNLFLSSGGQLFYLWACTHLYGITDEKDRPGRLRFYFPKVFLIGSYAIIRFLYRIPLGLSPAKLPLTTFLVMIRNFQVLYPAGFSQWPKDIFYQVVGLTSVEVLIAACIVRRVIITSKNLRTVSYTNFRSKQLGFRFFLMQNIIAYTLFILADGAIVLFIPRSFALRFILKPPYIHLFYNYRFGPGPRLLNYATTIITAYVNLPADSHGIMGWIRGTGENAETDKEPITLTIRDQNPTFNVHYFTSRFVFDLQVMLCNIAEVAYGRKSSKETRVAKSLQYVVDNGYNVEEELYHEASDTFALILTSFDRIIVTFKGTTSTQNVASDLKMIMTSASDAIPTYARVEHEVLKSKEWKAARIHQGFVDSYLTLNKEILAKLIDLQHRNSRPIYFTGHSLGGALASICSLDVALCLNRKDVYVSTFGSPKVGNFSFTKAYDSIIAAHWRVAMRSDIITTLPRLGYAHVGKRVALTASGEMFLDPNAIETSLWSSEGKGLAGHKIPAYMDAFSLFASKYIPSYTPEFIACEDEGCTSYGAKSIDQTSSHHESLAALASVDLHSQALASVDIP